MIVLNIANFCDISSVETANSWDDTCTGRVILTYGSECIFRKGSSLTDISKDFENQSKQNGT